MLRWRGRLHTLKQANFGVCSHFFSVSPQTTRNCVVRFLKKILQHPFAPTLLRRVCTRVSPFPGSAELEEVALDTRFPEEVRRRVFPVVGRSLITNFGLTLRSCRARYRGKKLSVLRENLKTDRKHFSRKRPKRNSRTVARKKLRRYQKCFRTAVVVDDANALELFFTISVCSGGIQLSSSPENSSPANSKALLHFTFN